jgi:hypothetical protein
MKLMKLLFSILLSFFLFQSSALAQTAPSNCSNSFIGCVTSRFSTKFPFNIVANIPRNQIQCPAVNFTVGTGTFSVSRNFDICWIYDLVRVVKYPLMAALIIKIYLFS